MKVIDLTGQKFGRLTVICRTENVKGKAAWKCKCSCGNKLVVSSNNLRRHNTLSCGCYHKEQTSKASKKLGMSRTHIYYIWTAMKQRCFNPKCKSYKNYGGRGIKVCDEWLNDFQAFYDYVSQLPHFEEKGYTLDRINNDGNYEPDNVKWSTKLEQRHNQRRCKNGIEN